jgi:hypothetical protein
VLLVIDLDDTPWVTASSDLSTIGTSDLGIRTNNSERNFRHNLIVLSNRLIVVKLITRTLEDLDGVVLDISENLKRISIALLDLREMLLTLALKLMISSSVIVSALAMTGIKLTLV